jgi:hypothetical protein
MPRPAVGDAGGALCAAALLLSACAPPMAYFGLSLDAPVTPAEQMRLEAALAQPAAASGCRWRIAQTETIVNVPCDAVPLTAIARAAAADNKQAQLELGVRFEEGLGVPRDLTKARKLYRMAARGSISGQPIGFPDYSDNLIGRDEGGDSVRTDPRLGRGEAPSQPSPRGLAQARERLRNLSR